MKSYTDIEQSKKLTEILPLESADLYYYKYGLPHFIEGQGDYESIRTDKYHDYIPCWSLTALFNIFDWPKLSSSSLGVGISVYPNGYRHDSRLFDNPIDACYEMILRLHELNLL